jgi:transposase-like protein
MRFDPRTRGEIVGAIRMGVSCDRAATSANVNPRTLRRWKTQGEADIAAGSDTAHARFVRSLHKAESDALGQVETNVWQQSQDDWRAGAWLLSKKDPRRYGKEPDEREALQKAIVAELFDFLQKHVSGGAFTEVCDALVSYGNEEIDERALPCPG